MNKNDTFASDVDKSISEAISKLPVSPATNASSLKTYKLTGVINYKGEDKAIGDEVELDDQQADNLRESGHIA